MTFTNYCIDLSLSLLNLVFYILLRDTLIIIEMKDSCMLFEIQNICGQRIIHDYYNDRVHSLLHFNNNHTVFLPRIQVFLKPCIAKPHNQRNIWLYPPNRGNNGDNEIFVISLEGNARHWISQNKENEFLSNIIRSCNYLWIMILECFINEVCNILQKYLGIVVF